MTDPDATAAVIELYEAIDAGDVDRVLGFFTETATFETSLGTSTGTDELRAFFTGRIDQPGRRALHVLANARARALAHDAVEVHGQVLLFGPDPASPPALRLERAVPAVHLVRLLGGRWVIAERRSPAPPSPGSTIPSRAE